MAATERIFYLVFRYLEANAPSFEKSGYALAGRQTAHHQ